MVPKSTEQRVAEPIRVKIPEAVRLTGLSRSRIYELMKTGEIDFAKVGSSSPIIVESLRRSFTAAAPDRRRAGLAPAPASTKAVEAERQSRPWRKQNGG